LRVSIEDEEDIQELVRHHLSRDGYEVVCADNGEDGLRGAAAESPDLILLDLMLPKMHGSDVCRRLKEQSATKQIPVIMLTSKSGEADVVTGLELGADDYVTKPFSPSVLIARIRTALRRSKNSSEETLEFLEVGNLEVHPGKHDVHVSGRRVDLTATEFRILEFMIRRPGWVQTRSQIVEALWGDHHSVTDRSVDVQIVSLRKKLKSAGDLIETVRGVGYRLKDIRA
jgi:two-component system alkaline phosphatase synthesis response regulator PhoP